MKQRVLPFLLAAVVILMLALCLVFGSSLRAQRELRTLRADVLHGFELHLSTVIFELEHDIHYNNVSYIKMAQSLYLVEQAFPNVSELRQLDQLLLGISNELILTELNPEVIAQAVGFMTQLRDKLRQELYDDSGYNPRRITTESVKRILRDIIVP